MKKALLTLFALMLAAGAYAQVKQPKEVKQAKQEKQVKQEKKETAARGSIPNGYGKVEWGTALSKARESVEGKLVFTDEKTEIITRDGDLEYHYGFFYVDPAVSALDKGSGEGKDTKGAEGDKDEGQLFFVSLKFPYLAMKEVKDKMEMKYGPSTNENLTKNQGAIAWDSANTIVVMWVDRYQNMPYCRRITYISKDIARKLNEYQGRVFKKAELELIQKLYPQKQQ